MVPATSDDTTVHAFNIIDTNKDGRISREEFLGAAEDILLGVEETQLSEAVFG